mmetsp:Transcript_127311/g.207191  ORF Transcript_127311/g.207191 Transcript_127311/m.207191 type:complete len:91 (-) Transcript_127311:79-351(-)
MRLWTADLHGPGHWGSAYTGPVAELPTIALWTLGSAPGSELALQTRGAARTHGSGSCLKRTASSARTGTATVTSRLKSGRGGIVVVLRPP